VRKLLAVVAILAVVYVVASHYHWKWIYPSTYFGSSPTVQNGHGTCGTVADVHYAANSKGQPTFIDLGHAYPNQDLTVIIWGKKPLPLPHPAVSLGRPAHLRQRPHQELPRKTRNHRLRPRSN